MSAAMLCLGLAALNRDVGTKEDSTSDTSVAVSMQRPRPKTKAAPPPPKKRKPRRSRPRSAAPRPQLATNLGGLAVGLPDFAAGGLGDFADDLVGSEALGGNLVMTEDTVDEAPRPDPNNQAPRAPARAAQRGLRGFVKVSLRIDKTGRVTQASVVESEPGDVFDQAVLDVVRDWRFSPARYRGQAVDLRTTQRIVFQ